MLTNCCIVDISALKKCCDKNMISYNKKIFCYIGGKIIYNKIFFVKKK